MKRIGLFLLTNFAVLAVLAVTSRLLGVDRFLTQNGLDLPALFGFAAVFGMGGAFISLAISRWMAKRATGARVIDTPANATERWLVDTVARQAQQAGLGLEMVRDVLPLRAADGAQQDRVPLHRAIQHHALDLVAVGKLEQPLGGAVDRLLGPAHLRPPDRVALGHQLLDGVHALDRHAAAPAAGLRRRRGNGGRQSWRSGRCELRRGLGRAERGPQRRVGGGRRRGEKGARQGSSRQNPGAESRSRQGRAGQESGRQTGAGKESPGQGSQRRPRQEDRRQGGRAGKEGPCQSGAHKEGPRQSRRRAQGDQSGYPGQKGPRQEGQVSPTYPSAGMASETRA